MIFRTLQRMALAAALLALSVRSSGVSLFARAFPPFNPPNRPRATAAAFFFALLIVAISSFYQI